MKTRLFFFLLVAVSMSEAGRFWGSASLGGTSLAGAGGTLSISCDVLSFPVSYRYGGAAGGGSGMFVPSKETLEERALLVGYYLPENLSVLSVGLSHIKGRHRGAVTGRSFFGSSYSYESYKAFGFTMEYMTMKTYWSTIGLGLTLSGNFSKEITYFSALVSLNLGKLSK